MGGRARHVTDSDSAPGSAARVFASPGAGGGPLIDAWPEMALGGLCVVGFAFIVILSTRLAFFNDDWYFLLQRPGLESHGGLDTLLAPHNGNLVIVVAAIFKLLVAVSGMHHVWPFRIISAASWAALGVVLFVYIRARLGPLIALLATALVMFLGPAWEAMLFFSGGNHVWAVGLGLASLLALERDSPRRNATACGLLTVGVAASNTALALTAGAAIAILMRRRPRQLWVVAVPVAVFGLWWIGYGRGQQTGVTAGHIAGLPGYMFDSLSSGLSTLLGLKHSRLPGLLHTGHLPAAVVLVALVVWLVRGGRPRPAAYWVAGSLVVFWILTGASAIPGRGAESSRYQVVEAVLILATAAELLHGVRVAPAPAAGLAVIVGAILASNLIVLDDGYRFLRVETGFAAADTGALQLAGPARADDTWLLTDVAGDPYLSGITAPRYFAQTARYGSPAFDTPSQLLAAATGQRAAADGVLIAADAIAPRVVTRSPRRACTRLAPAPGTRASVALPVGTTVIENRGAAVLVLFLNRFGPAATAHGVAFLAPHVNQAITIPADAARVPWHLGVENPQHAAGVAAVCDDL